MKRLIVLASLAFGVVVVGGGLYGRLQSSAPAPTTNFYGDGQTKNSTVYVGGVKEGPSTQWYSNGQKEWDGSFQAGFREGDWSFWNEDGSLDRERSGAYERGRKVAGL